MRRRVLLPAMLALTAALLGACKATDTAGNTSSNATAPKTTGKSNTSANTSTNTSTSAQTGTTEVHADGIRRVNVAELQKMVESGSVVIYDTRAKMQYEQEHIKGARSLPQGEADARAGELPRDKTLVFYCT